MNIISPSILSADFANLAHDIKKIPNAQMLHIDVMDGHFVPNISIGAPVVSSIRKATDTFLDVHLMISDPLFYAPEFAKAGADLICFHYEAEGNVKETISAIKKLDKKIGIAIKPQTPASVLDEIIRDIDMVLVMTVEPGFGGQAFMGDMLPKIKEVRKMIDDNKLKVDIQVDGGINEETAKLCVAAGATILVAGSYVFNSENPMERVELLKSI